MSIVLDMVIVSVNLISGLLANKNEVVSVNFDNIHAPSKVPTPKLSKLLFSKPNQKLSRNKQLL